MLHELLLALSGHPGSIFVKNSDGKIQVVGELPFIHPTEVVLLNRLSTLATHYTRFVAFIRKHGHSPGGGDTVGLHGLYMRALCQGLDEILSPYRQTLLDIERELLADPHLTAAHVHSILQEYQLLLPALSIVLDQIEQQRAHGCHILDIVHKAAICGMPIVKTALRRVLFVCHGVLYKQLAAWMLHGLLLDHYSEFFIHQVDKAVTLSHHQVEEDELGLAGVTGKQLQQIFQLSDMPETIVYEKFGLRAEMLPHYIVPRVAEKILFVGESVQMFESEKHTPKHKHRGSILKEKEDVFAKELCHLAQQDEFNLMTFEAVIDKIRTYVAEQLWKLVVEEAELLSHLRVMKDFFLLGRGELFLAFIDQAQGRLSAPPTGTTQHDVNTAFQQAARSVLFDDEAQLEKFVLTVEHKQKATQQQQHRKAEVSSQGQAESGWSLLNLTCSVEWPLHILFTQGVRDRYNSLFKFLLYVRRTQLELQQCWALHMTRKHLHSEDVHSTKWWLRNHMAFLVDNLQYYLQADVIESQFSILLQKIEATRDFEAIRLAHDNFLTSLLSQSFLLMKPIAHCLTEILDQCHGFCYLVSHAEAVLTDKEAKYLEIITLNFQRQSSLLFKILSSVRSHQASPHLAQLLLRIDFNKYFTMSGGQLGSYQTVNPDSIQTPSSSRN